jgi:hypothetical protein
MLVCCDEDGLRIDKRIDLQESIVGIPGVVEGEEPSLDRKPEQKQYQI